MGAFREAVAVSPRPLQKRAQETHHRIYEAALDEYERVGIDAARVDDIVTAAGVGWGTFFRHFPRKEDVLVEAAVEMARACARAADKALAEELSTTEALTRAIATAGAAALSGRPKLRLAMVREVAAHPEQFAAHMMATGEPTLAETVAVILEAGQRRGEVRTDYPARAMAQICMAAVTAAHRQDLTRDPVRGTGSAPAQGQVSLAIELVTHGFATGPGDDDDRA